MPDKRVRVEISLPKAKPRKTVGKKKRYGPFSPPEGEDIPIGTIKMTLFDMTAFWRQEVPGFFIHLPQSSTIFYRSQHPPFPLPTTPTALQVDQFSAGLFSRASQGGAGVGTFPRDIPVGKFVNTTTLDRNYRTAPFNWPLSYNHINQYGVTIGLQGEIPLTTDQVAFRRFPSASERLAIELAKEDPDPDRIEALQWEIQENDNSIVFGTAWFEFNEFTDDLRGWWDNYGFIQRRTGTRLKPKVLNGGHYYEEVDFSDSATFKFTGGQSFDSVEFSVPFVNSNRPTRLYLVPKLWRIKYNFNVHYGNPASPTTVPRELVAYTWAQSAPMVNIGAFAGIAMEPLSVPSAEIGNMIARIDSRPTISKPYVQTVAYGGVTDDFIVYDRGSVVNPFVAGTDAILTVSVAGYSPARYLAGGLQTVIPAPNNATPRRGNVWAWRRAERTYPDTATVIPNTPAQANFGIDVNSGNTAVIIPGPYAP